MFNKLFKVDDDSRYTFHMKNITSHFYFRNKKALDEAEKLFGNNRVAIKTVKLEKMKYNLIHFETEIIDFDDTIHTVIINANEYNMLSILCRPKHEGHSYYDHTDFYRSPCKYEISAMLALNEYIKEYNPGDTTDYDASLLINSFSRMQPSAEECFKKKEDAILEMSLNFNTPYNYSLRNFSDGLCGTFRVGNQKKMYVVKDFYDLLEKYRNNDTLKLGKLVELDFSKSDFSSESKKVLAAIEQWIHEAELINEKLRNKYIYENISMISKDTIVFDESMLDKLYDIFHEKVALNGLPVQKSE